MELIATAAEQRTGYRPEVRAGQAGADREQVRAAALGRGPSGAGKRRWRGFSPEARIVHLSVGDAVRILLARPAGPQSAC